MNKQHRVYIHAAVAANPFGTTDVMNQQPLEPGYTPPSLKPVIKELCGHSLRQASNLVELGVIGAQTLKLRLGGELLPDSRLYVATGMGDITKNLKLFQQVSPPANGLAAPFDFINSSANTTAFYVAKLLGLNSRNLTVSRDEFSFEIALQIAVSDITCGAVNNALLGGIDEIANFAYTHFIKMTKEKKLLPGQGCGWLYLTGNRKNALGELIKVIKINTDYSMAVDAWSKTVFDVMQDNLRQAEPMTLMPAYTISQSELTGLAKYFGDCAQENYIQYSGAYNTASAFGMARVFEFDHDRESQYLHITRSETGETMCVFLRAYPK